MALLPGCVPAVDDPCGSISLSVVIDGGTATVDNWTASATEVESTDFHNLPTNNTPISVERGFTYQIDISAVDAALANKYSAALSCNENSNRVSWDSTTRRVTFTSNTSDNGEPRALTCTYTLTAAASTTITTYVAGDRDGLAGIDGLAGATLRMWTGTDAGPAAPIAEDWAQCISTGADGKCVFTVPEATTTNAGKQFWIVPETAPVGWRINTDFATGGSGSTITKYAAQTDPISADPQDSRVDFMIGTGSSSARASGGTFVMSRDNVSRDPACGVDVALLFDLSGSLAGQLPQIKEAGSAMVTALEGTNSTVGVYTFASNAPASAGSTLAQTQVSTAAGADAVRAHIASFSTPTGATNWDRGLSQIPNLTYDVVLVITDGNPTFYGGEEGPGDYTRFREVENGALSANELKANGTRIVAVGVGAGIGGPANNLAAISGPVADGDYFQEPTFDAAAAAVRNAALGDCLGSLTIVKQVVPNGNAGEDVTGATPAGGWTFDAVSQTAGLAVGNGGTGATAPVTGAVNFPLTYTGGTSTGTVRVNEQLPAGYGIVTQGGMNAVCTATLLNGDTSPVSVTNQTVGTNPAFDVPVPANASVSCTVYNKPQLVKTSITVEKVWTINGVEYSNAENPFMNEGLTASLLLDGTAQPWNVPRGDIDEGTAVEINETMTAMPTALPQCRVAGVELRDSGGDVISMALPYDVDLDADAELNMYTINNVVTCGSQLTLIKTVANGSASPSDWTLTAYGPDSAIPGPTGPTQVTGPVSPNVRYELGESGPATYVQSVAPNAVITPPSTGSWVCVQLDAQGNVIPGFSDGLNGGVTVPLGASVRCAAINRTAFLVLEKHVTNDNGGEAGPEDFTLTATPDALVGLSASTVAGDSVTSPANTITVRPDHVYTLTESSVPGYAFSKLQQWVGGSWVDVVANPDPAGYPQQNDDGNWQVKVSPLATDIYRFVNDDMAPKLTLIKSVVNQWGTDAEPTDWTLYASSSEGNFNGQSGVTGTVHAGVGYSLSESGGADGFKLTDLTCTSGLVGTTVTAQVGENITCIFTNTAQPGELTLYKVVNNDNGGSAVETDWDGLLEARMGDADTLYFDHSETREVTPGTYTLNEGQGPTGYLWTDLYCSNQRPEIAPAAVAMETSLEDPVVTIGAGERWSCWFTNTSQKPTLTLEKEIINTGGGLASADDWTLTAMAEVTLISGTGTIVSENVAAISGEAVADTPITLGEMGPSGYTASDWACRDTGSGDPIALDDGQLWLEIGEDATCRIVNTAIPATGTVDKQVTSAVQNEDGTWTVEYEITVTNNSEFSGYEYSLSDELQYGEGIDIIDATWSGNGMTDQPFADDGTATLATDEVIDPPFGTEVYTVTVNADVTADAYDDGTTWCDPYGSEAGGFLNTAYLTDDNDGGESHACAEPYTPMVDKSTEHVVDNGDGTWTLTYNLTVVAPLAPEGETVFYDLTDELNLPDGVDMVGDATATAIGSTPAPTNASFDGEGIWTIVDNGSVGSEAHIYQVTVTLSTSEEAVNAPWVCQPEGEGIAVGNTGTIISGNYEDSDDVCDVVHYDDVSIDKTAGLGEDQTSVEPGDTFDYELTVTNHGTRPALDVLVTDTSINDRLVITNIAVSAGHTWSSVPGYDANDVAVMIDEIGIEESVTITVTVMFTLPEVTDVLSEEVDPPAPVPIEEFINEACVEMTGDQNPENDCDTVTIPVRDVAAVVSAVCVGDAPYLHWTVVKSETLRDEPINFLWTPNTPGAHEPPNVELTEPGGSLSWTDEIEWPGSAFTPEGVSIDYPGWRLLQASDYAPGGGFYIPGTTTVMTPEEEADWIFNGMILDPSELDYAWRLDSTVTFSVNPEVSFTAVYPEALPECAVARHSEVEVEKTASVEKAMPGDTIKYTIAVQNISDDSAADGVIITDEIPSTLKVTDVTWPGEDDESVFPNWESCQIAGANAQGYGGMLTCTLFGPLQPVGVGTAVAPTLTLTATVAASAPAGQITNVAIVDYHTFGDPDDKGRDSDDAVVTIGAANKPPTLPATGEPVNGLWLLLGLIGLVGGAGLLVTRRQREERSRL